MQRGAGLIRIAIVEDQLLFAEALDVALTREGLQVVRVPPEDHQSPSTLLTTVLRLRPTVVLVGVDHTGTGTRLVNPLTRAGIAVVAMTASADGARWGEALRQGARTVLPLSSTMRDVLTTIRLVAAGRTVLDHDERERLVAQFHREKATLQELRRGLDQLTSREQEVLCRLREGLSVSEIASWACVSESTVRTQVKSILAKLGVSSQLAAVGATYRTQWSPPAAVAARR